MASLVGALTALTLAGVPGQVAWQESAVDVSATDTASISATESAPTLVQADLVEITALGPHGQPMMLYGSLEGKSSPSTSIVNVTDTAVISATEDPVDEQYITTTESVRLSLSETAALFNYIGVTETASLAISEGVGISGSGTLDLTPTETASLSVSESVAVDVEIAVTDDATIDSSDSGTVAVSTDSVTVTETASLSVTELVVLDVFTGFVAVTVADGASIGVTEATPMVETIIPASVSVHSIHFRLKTPRTILRLKT